MHYRPYKIDIESSYTVDSSTGCWVWKWARTSTGYGAYGYTSPHTGERHTSAHRYFYETFVGQIGEGMEVDHTCLTRACVNPDHLRLLGHAENVRRASSLDWQKVRAMRALWVAGDATAAAIGRLFGVSASCAGLILKNKRWHDPDYVRPRIGANGRPLKENR